MKWRQAAVLFLALGLSSLLGCQLPWGRFGGVPPVEPPVGLQFAFADAGADPGFVRAHLDTPPGEETVYTRGSGGLASFCFHPGAPKLYFVSGEGNTLWRADYINGIWYEEFPVYPHGEVIRCVRFVHDEPGQYPEDPTEEWHLFFSVASGATEDGVIYRVVGRSVETYYTVDLDEVDGYWGGWFGFSPTGELYLSSGNRTQAALYRVSAGGVEKVYQGSGSMAGFVFLSPTTLLFADWGQRVYFLDLEAGETALVYENTELEQLSDVDLLPDWWAGD